MSTKAPAEGVPTRVIDDTLKDTEFGEMILHHKALVVGVFTAAVVIAVGYGLFTHFAQKKIADRAAKIYSYKSAYLDHFKKKDPKEAAAAKKEGESEAPKVTVTAEQIMANVAPLISEYSGDQTIIPVVLETYLALKDNGHQAKGLELLKKIAGGLKSNQVTNFYVISALAAALEDSGDYKTAIEHIEGLTKTGKVLFEEKLYLDLGRLYGLVGNKDKARESLEYLVKNHPTSEMTKLAKLYLTQWK
ncbi:MAG: hypothetical protein HOE90_23095 [Bacteriovoracaceae bacterium]|jgi:tetratricopeptide (TPR) repeat protein|nr:hypothetical protein [Bacteriovoracaceae bacterium]